MTDQQTSRLGAYLIIVIIIAAIIATRIVLGDTCGLNADTLQANPC